MSCKGDALAPNDDPSIWVERLAVAEGFAFWAEDPNVPICDEHNDAGVLVGAADADVVESAL